MSDACPECGANVQALMADMMALQGELKVALLEVEDWKEKAQRMRDALEEIRLIADTTLAGLG